MKKIINNKRYDTATATEIASCNNNCNVTDFQFLQESLYIKKTGEYFLCGHGGPMTKYAESAGTNQWMSGSAITPLSAEEAREWAEEHMPADEYAEHFAVAAEPDILAIVGTRIRAVRESQGVTQTQLADMTGTTPAMIGKYERGEVEMGVSRFIAINRALGIADGRFIAE